jgi:CRISPR/Cas system-associated exonuclease Cas4 (RecB family)
VRLGGWKLPLERLSATSLSTYIQCPESFRRKYILNEPEGMSGDRFVGSVTHQALHRLFTEEIHVGDDASDIVGEIWQEIITKEGEPDWHDTDATKAYKTTKKMLTTYWPYVSEEKPVAVEQRFEEKIAGVPVVGYIDVELDEVIREVKTSSRKESKPKQRHLLQGRLYSLVSTKPVTWHYVTRQVTPRVYTPAECPGLMLSFNPDLTVLMMRQVIERMNDDYARYGRDETWPLSGTFHDWACGYCSFKKNCPAWS